MKIQNVIKQVIFASLMLTCLAAASFAQGLFDSQKQIKFYDDATGQELSRFFPAPNDRITTGRALRIRLSPTGPLFYDKTNYPLTVSIDDGKNLGFQTFYLASIEDVTRFSPVILAFNAPLLLPITAPGFLPLIQPFSAPRSIKVNICRGRLNACYAGFASGVNMNANRLALDASLPVVDAPPTSN